MKTCRVCNIKKSIDSFEKNRRVCRCCKNEYHKKMYLLKKKERLAQKKEYYQKNKDVLVNKKRTYRKENKSTVKKSLKKYQVNNLDKFNSINAKRRSKKLNATPNWADLDKIQILYEKAKWLESVTGLKYHVDHIIPLQGEDVCGLHVWENLQILEASLNLSKNSKFDISISM